MGFWLPLARLVLLLCMYADILSSYIKNTFSKLTYQTMMSLQIAIGLQQWRTQKFCSEGVQQIQLRTEDRENGDLGAVAP